MIFRQCLHSDPVGASYLFGCAGRAAAAVVDPVGDIAPYLRAAEETGMRIRYVIDTHLHADHVSSGRRLAEAASAEYVLFADAKVTFPFRGAHDGEVLELGNVTIKILHTPGHTPEHISMLVTDRTRSDEPWFVLTVRDASQLVIASPNVALWTVPTTGSISPARLSSPRMAIMPPAQ